MAVRLDNRLRATVAAAVVLGTSAALVSAAIDSLVVALRAGRDATTPALALRQRLLPPVQARSPGAWSTRP